MNKIWIFLLLIVLSNCSLDTKSGFWTQDKKIQKENKNITKVLLEKKAYDKEFNSNLNLRIDFSNSNNEDINQLTNICLLSMKI